MVNLRELPDEELEYMLDTTEAYLKKLQSETQRRLTIASAAEMVNDLNLRYFQALGRVDGAEWEGPSTASESYPRDWTVTHEAGVWRSLESGNIEEPGQGDAWEWIGRDPRVALYPGDDVLPGGDVILGSDDEDDDGDEAIEPGGDDA